MAFERLTRLEALHVLLGEWRGRGTWNGAPITLRSSCTRQGDALELRILATPDTGAAHSETAVFVAAENGVVARTRSRAGDPQSWKVGTGEPVPTFVLLHGDPDDRRVRRMRWTLALPGDDAYAERFEIAPPGEAFRVASEGRYVRVGTADG